MLFRSDKENLVFYSVLAGAVVDLIINMICIPSMASAGAAVGTLVAEFVVLIIQIVMLRERIREFMQPLQIGKILVAVSCAAAVCLWVKQVDISAFFALVMSAMIFFVVYVLVLAILKEQFMSDIIVQISDVWMRK